MALRPRLATGMPYRGQLPRVNTLQFLCCAFCDAEFERSQGLITARKEKDEEKLNDSDER